jgi:hypothetical protein
MIGDLSQREVALGAKTLLVVAAGSSTQNGAPSQHVILPWPLVARLELLGLNELADIVPSDVVYHVDSLFITRKDAKLFGYFIFGDQFSPKFGAFLMGHVECELLIMGAGLARRAINAIVRSATRNNRLRGAFPLTAHVRVAAPILSDRDGRCHKQPSGRDSKA